MKIRIKKLNNAAIIPQYAHSTDAGLDLTAVSMRWYEGHIWEYGCGLAFEIPEGYVGLLFPRSSVYKTGAILTNCVGVIDSGYRGEVKAKFVSRTTNAPYSLNDRFAQLIIVPYPKIELEESDELSSTDRGEGGFGSSGK